MQSSHSTKGLLVRGFYESHCSWLYTWLFKKVGSTFDAADLTQDTFMRVLGKNDLSSILEPRAYLTKIAHGLMVNFLRRREIEQSYLEEITYLAEGRCQSPEERAIVLETLTEIDIMLNNLPHKVRAAFLLLLLEGMTHAEIAAELNVSVASVRLYIAKAVTHCLEIQ